jgi:Helix-turn-helix domain
MTNRPPLTIEEAIDSLGVSDKTVRRMLKAGILQEQERDPKGRILISALSVDQVVARLTEQRDHEGHAEWLPAQTMAQTTALGLQRDMA